jgi:hypothetical protein
MLDMDKWNSRPQHVSFAPPSQVAFFMGGLRQAFLYRAAEVLRDPALKSYCGFEAACPVVFHSSRPQLGKGTK